MIGARAFWICAAFALAVHAAVLFAAPGLQGGADLLPHLQLIEAMQQGFAVRSVYAPAYHVLGAALAPAIGLAGYTKLFAWLAAALLIGGFRAFQRAAGLPDACAALFAFSPYLVSLSHCAPKVEAAGYGLALVGLAFLLRGQLVFAALTLAATFWVHTAGALFLGLAGGVLSLARRDARGLAALAAGSVLASPLFALHLRDGCSLAQALLFSEGDYLRAQPLWGLRVLDLVVLLANPIALAAAVVGARATAERDRPLAWLCAVLLALYANELWLAPLGRGTTLNLLRGLTVLAIPVSVSAGVALSRRPRLASAALGASALWLALCAALVVPRSCMVRPIAAAELVDLRVDRCVFRWQGPNLRHPGGSSPGGVERPE